VTAGRQRRYWDSATFIGLLTLAEVVKLRRHPPLTKDDAASLRAFFKHDWIVVRQVTRLLAEAARELVWDEGIDPKDAIHVATALDAGVVQLDTFDTGLINMSGRLGVPPLVIGHPNVPEQLNLGGHTEE